jgi:GNAT superfamily N-acetyltransferase
MLIRKATMVDADGIAQLLAGCAVDHPARGRTPSAAWVRDHLLSDPAMCRLIVAERRHALIGFCAWRPSYDMLWGVRGGDISWLFVEPEARGLAVAPALIAATRDRTRTSGQSGSERAGTVETIRFLRHSLEKEINGCRFYTT